MMDVSDSHTSSRILQIPNVDTVKLYYVEWLNLGPCLQIHVDIQMWYSETEVTTFFIQNDIWSAAIVISVAITL